MISQPSLCKWEVLSPRADQLDCSWASASMELSWFALISASVRPHPRTLPAPAYEVFLTRPQAEMITYMPIASPFVRLSGFWVDDALSFAMGWNYFFLMGEFREPSSHGIPWSIDQDLV